MSDFQVLFVLRQFEGNQTIILQYDRQGRKVRYTKFEDNIVDSIIKYDIYSNPTKLLYADKGYYPRQKMLEKKYEYVYDYYGNWVVKKTFLNSVMSIASSSFENDFILNVFELFVLDK